MFMPNEQDLEFMQLALVEAQKARALGEVPVGAVLVSDNQVIARSEERRVGKECRSRWSPYH